MQYYVLNKKRERLGPFDESRVIEGLESREFKAKHLACHDGMTTWKPLGALFPRFRLAALIKHAIIMIAISLSLVVAMIVAMLYFEVKSNMWWGVTQAFVLLVLHIGCLALLLSAHRSRNPSTAIAGMMPGVIWNLVCTVVSFGFVVAGKPSPGGSLGAMILLDYWWISNLVRFINFRRRFRAEEYDSDDSRAILSSQPNIQNAVAVDTAPEAASAWEPPPVPPKDHTKTAIITVVAIVFILLFACILCGPVRMILQTMMMANSAK